MLSTVCRRALSTSWSVSSAVIVERPPLLKPDPHPTVSEYHKLRLQRAQERSVLSDFEYQCNSEAEKIVTQKKENTDFDSVHALDLPEYFNVFNKEDQEKAVLNDTYLKATDASIRSKEASPREAVYLIVQDNDEWVFPSKVIDNEKSLDSAITASLQSHGLDAKITSSLPVTVHINKYSRKLQEHTGQVGMKTFFLKSMFQSGAPEGNFKWVTKSELKDHLSEKYLKSVLPVLS